MIHILACLFFLQTTPTKTPSNEMKALAEMQSSRSVMLITPEQRAADYVKAFELLKAEKSSSKVFFELADGSKISNVVEMTPMPNFTMIVFQYNTSQGIQYKVVETADILGVMHQ